jgi:hypothetical protein
VAIHWYLVLRSGTYGAVPPLLSAQNGARARVDTSLDLHRTTELLRSTYSSYKAIEESRCHCVIMLWNVITRDLVMRRDCGGNRQLRLQTTRNTTGASMACPNRKSYYTSQFGTGGKLFFLSRKVLTYLNLQAAVALGFTTTLTDKEIKKYSRVCRARPVRKTDIIAIS